ncbi:MAG: hypothetical protein Q4P71_06355 [Actinomycetaceae bacterium]|nr:hypothetical protein [Actinomycetaceae bacterium]
MSTHQPEHYSEQERNFPPGSQVDPSHPYSRIELRYSQSSQSSFDPVRSGWGYDSSDDSFWSWMLATLLALIPIVGFIYLVVVAAGQTPSPARKNWARAMLVWQLIGMLFALYTGSSWLSW